MNHSRGRLIGATLVAGLALGVGSAQAATFGSGNLTVTTSSTAPTSAIAAPSGPSTAQTGQVQVVSGTDPSNWKSPFTGISGLESAEYVAILGGTFSVTYSALQSSISFLWGTPDTYNSLSFSKGNAVVGVLSGIDFIAGSLVSAGSTSFVNTMISVFGGFDKVTFASTSKTFEVGNVAATPVPGPVAAAGLPAALAMLVGFGLWRRRHGA